MTRVRATICKRTNEIEETGQSRLLGASSLVRMSMGSRAVFLSQLAMLMSSGCVLLRLFVLAERVVMRRLVVMMRSGVVVTSRVVMVLLGRMFFCL